MIFPLRVLGSSWVNVMYFGRVNLPSFSATCSRSSSASSVEPGSPPRRGDERVDRLARHVVDFPADGGFRDQRVIDQRALDFGRRDAVAADVHHVVDPAHEPVVSAVVAAAAVAREVHVLETSTSTFARSARRRPKCRAACRPRARQHDVSAAAQRHRLAALVDDVGLDSRERIGRAARAATS